MTITCGASRTILAYVIIDVLRHQHYRIVRIVHIRKARCRARAVAAVSTRTVFTHIIVDVLGCRAYLSVGAVAGGALRTFLTDVVGDVPGWRT